jgi:hypothetical protein
MKNISTARPHTRLTSITTILLSIALIVTMMPFAQNITNGGKNSASVYAEYLVPLPLNGTISHSFDHNENETSYRYYFTLSERTNLQITFSHETYATTDMFCWLRLDGPNGRIYTVSVQDGPENTINTNPVYWLEPISYTSPMTITYRNIPAGGPYYFEVTANGNIIGYANYSSYTITTTTALPLTNAVITGGARAANGKAQALAPTVVCNSAILTEGVDYTVEYLDSGDPGVAKITVRGIGNYSGSKTVTFAFTGWIKNADGGYRYFTDGKVMTGWQKPGGKWYYLSAANGGNMLTGWQTISGKRYYFGAASDGKMATGWRKISGKWYYFGSANDGVLKTGWQRISGKWYYLGSDGAMRTGNVKIGNRTYRFNSSGVWV